MIKLILTDLDHTLLRSDGSISGRTLFTLERCRDRGLLVAIATARYWIGAEKYITMLSPDYEITTDGTLIHSRGECIYSCTLSEEDTEGIIQDILRAVPSAEITAACGNTVYWNSKHIAESEKLHKAVYFEYDRPLGKPANKIVTALPDESIARTIAEKFGCRLQSYRGENWYGFIPRDSGKTAAINALLGVCGITAEETAAFGDDINDRQMLEMCGTGVAVANAVDEVLAIADTVTLSNDEDGVAVWIEKNLL